MAGGERLKRIGVVTEQAVVAAVQGVRYRRKRNRGHSRGSMTRPAGIARAPGVISRERLKGIGGVALQAVVPTLKRMRDYERSRGR